MLRNPTYKDHLGTKKSHSKILYDPPPRIMKIQTKINKWNLIKFRRFSIVKETLVKMKTQPTEWEKIFVNDESDKGLIFKIYKKLMKLNMKKKPP